jgi:hypothetical protein
MAMEARVERPTPVGFLPIAGHGNQPEVGPDDSRRCAASAMLPHPPGMQDTQAAEYDAYRATPVALEPLRSALRG